MKELQTKICEWLTSKGYRPEVVEDRIFFPREGKIFMIMMIQYSDDLKFFQLVFPNFFDLGSLDRDMILASAAATSGCIKIAKVVLVDNQVWATAESICTSADQFTSVLELMCQATLGAVAKFRDEVKKRSAADPLSGALSVHRMKFN